NAESDDSDFLLARCNPNGSLDQTVGVGGKVRTSFGDLNAGANGAVLQTDGKIAAVGFNPTQKESGVEFALARYLATSSSQPTPTPTATPNATPTASPAPSPTATATPTATPMPTPSGTPTATPRPTPTPRPNVTPRHRPTPTPRP